jgi:hypothetical protein
MAFDEKAYERFLTPYGRRKTIPDDLLERYAITLPATDTEIAAQLKAVRTYWNKKMVGQTGLARTAKSCKTADDELAGKQPDLETAAWWQGEQRRRDQAARQRIEELARLLAQDHGTLGVVTAAALEKAAGSTGLSMAQAEQAAGLAKLAVIAASVTLPEAPPVSPVIFAQLERELADCGARSVPDLIHPGSGPFRIVAGYESVGDQAKRLDAAAIEARAREAGKNTSRANTARAGALQKLKDAQGRGVDLRDVTLWHLAELVKDASPSIARQTLENCGVESGDAATIVALLAGRAKAARESGLDRVRALLENGQLSEARSLAGTLAGDEMGDHAAQAVTAREQELAALMARVAEARQRPDEALAFTLLREAGRISADDADRELRTLPPAPPVQARATGDGRQVTVFWERGAGHDEATVYAVRRTAGRPPTAPTDGDEVHHGPGTECADPGAPVAAPVQYGVFALAGDGRPASRPVAVEVTALPPVWDVKHEVGVGTVALSWTAHQNAVVRVTRATPRTSPVPVPVTGNGCQATGLPEGISQLFEIVAVYRGPGGTELTSRPVPLSLVPRGEAKPNTTLKVTTTESNGRVRARLTWRRIDSSDVRILRTHAEPPWPKGAVVSTEQAERAGQLLAGRIDVQGAECALETELPGGIHYLTPLSEGGTGIVVGKTQSIAVISPVRNLSATPFADYATLAWEWPENIQLAEVRWKGGEEREGEEEGWEFTVLTLAEFRSKGVRVPLGAEPLTVQVCALIPVGTRHHPSPPASVVVRRVLQAPVRYQVSGGALGGRSRKVTFTADGPCAGVRVLMVASPGGIMPTRPASGVITVLEATLDLVPGVPVEHRVSIPKLPKPYWVRCFIVSGPGRLIDPPYKDLKED